MKRQHLTKQDVERLLTDGSGAARAETAAKIAAEFDADILTTHERSLALEIFRILAEDVELRVRQALSDNLKRNPYLPHDIAVALARDVDTVALPVLEFSQVLEDADLIEIVRERGAAKQIAIARRATVSEAVSEALIDSDNEAAVMALVSNEGAYLNTPALLRVVKTYGDSERVQFAMVRRPALPLTVSEKLLTVVSERLREELAKRQELPLDLATDLILQSRERATIGLAREADEQDVESLVAQMNRHGRLTPSIILRAACMGDITFMEAALAELAGTSLMSARKLIHDSGPLGLEAIYDKGGLPESHFPAIRAAVDMVEETDFDGRDQDRDRFRRRIIERVLTHYGDLGVHCEDADLEYLLAKMAELPSDATMVREQAA